MDADNSLERSLKILAKNPVTSKYMSFRPERALFHYTTQSGLIGILRDRQVWASQQESLNDESELSYSANFLQDTFNDYHVTRTGMNPVAITALSYYFERADFSEFPLSAFVASFTEDGDLLSQWERYAGPHGYCVGFDAERLRAVLAESGRNLTKVVYDTEFQRDLLNEIFDVAFDRLESGAFEEMTEESVERWANIHATIARSMSLTFKHPAFEREQEWRSVELLPDERAPALEVRPGAFGVVPYLPIPVSHEIDDSLSDVIIAPTKYEAEAKRAVLLTLRRFNYDVSRVNVHVSRVPLRV